MFLTSATYTGNLRAEASAVGLGTFGSGLEAGDALCQRLATAAALPGIYKAWLSDLTGSPSTRLTQWLGGYTRVDGVRVADSWADLTDGDLQARYNRKLCMRV